MTQQDIPLRLLQAKVSPAFKFLLYYEFSLTTRTSLRCPLIRWRSLPSPPGRYRLILALYDPLTMQRLPVRSADGQDLGDALDLGKIVVR